MKAAGQCGSYDCWSLMMRMLILRKLMLEVLMLMLRLLTLRSRINGFFVHSDVHLPQAIVTS